MIGLESLSEGAGRGERRGRVYGVVVGVVTSLEDETGLGRVKVRFPWLSDADESNWARVAAPMAGAARGIFFLPEVEDEVLVVFEHGLVNRPFILGALWNAKDKPPVTGDADNNLRSITSRSGSVIEFCDDEEAGATITIADKARKNTVIINAKENTVTITSGGDISITAKGNLTLESTGDLKLTGANVTVEAKQAAGFKGGTTAAIEAKSEVAITCSTGVNINNNALKVIG